MGFMHDGAVIPMLACFAGSGSADLRMLLGILGAYWMLAAIASVVNISLVMFFATRRRPVACHALLFGSYVAVSAGLYRGWMFEISAGVAVWGILLIPLVAIIQCFVLIKTYKTFGKLRAG